MFIDVALYGEVKKDPTTANNAGGVIMWFTHAPT